MINLLLDRIPELKKNWDKIKSCIKEIEVDSKTTLLCEGEISNKMYFIKKGCLRLAYNHKGKDITFQFFFENEAVSSFESFRTGQPSQFSIESIEPSTLLVLRKKDFENLTQEFPEMKSMMQEIMIMRLSRYTKLFLSFIKDTPKERYIELLNNNPQIIQRVPQHYIASYLGITPVSLSRIRKKLSAV